MSILQQSAERRRKVRQPTNSPLSGGFVQDDTPLSNTVTTTTETVAASRATTRTRKFAAPFGNTPSNSQRSLHAVDDVDVVKHDVVSTSAERAAAAAAATLRRIAVDEDYDVPSLSLYEHVKMFGANVYRTAVLSRVLLKLSWIDVKRRLCAYLLAFVSVTLVVTVCTVLMSVLGYMPLTLLDIADNTYGRTDLELRPGGVFGDGFALNYTLVKQLFPLRDGSDWGYHFPRITTTATMFSASLCNITVPDGNDVPLDWWKAGACDMAMQCVNTYCAPSSVYTTSLYIIDDALEQRAGITGDTKLPPPTIDSVVVSRDLARMLDIRRVGQYVTMYLSVLDLVPRSARHLVNFNYDSMFTLRVAAIVSTDRKKFNTGTYVAVINYGTLLQQLAKGLSPQINAATRAAFTGEPIDESVRVVTFLMPPTVRQRIYGSTDYATMRHAATVWAMPVVNKIGYTQITSKMPVIDALSQLAKLTMMLGMAFALVLLGVSLLCMLLIYAMLRVGVAARVYSTGIQRMIGFTRENTVALIVFNVYMFAVPGWVVGLVVGQVLHIFVSRTFESIGNIHMPRQISMSAFGWATLAAAVIPLLAACLPMYAMIRLRLCDALNMTRQRTSMVVYKIVSARQQRFNATYCLFGLVAAVVCALLYYFLPTAFLNNDLRMTLILYVALLCCLIIGLVLLMMNFQRMVEAVVAYALLFWESSVVFHVMLKYLNMHRSHNTLTTIMYALSVAFLLFVAVMFNMQIDSITAVQQRANGADVVLVSEHMTLGMLSRGVAIVQRTLTDKIVVGVAYMVPSARILAVSSPRGAGPSAQRQVSATLRSIGRYRDVSHSLVAVSPSFFEVTGPQFLNVFRTIPDCDRYGLAGALYALGNDARVVMSTSSFDQLALSDLDGQAVLETRVPSDQMHDGASSNGDDSRPVKSSVTLVQPAAVLSSAGGVSMSRYNVGNDDVIISFPLAAALTNSTGTSVLSLIPSKTLVRLRDVKDAAMVRSYLLAALSADNITGVEVRIAEGNGLDSARGLLNRFFVAIEVVVLAVCLISLLSSMMTNVLRSSKDIGILLCIGMTHFQLYRVYIWEAFVLVVASGMLGVVVGTVVAYTMQLQMSMTTQQSVPFTFPYMQIVVMVGVGFVSAFVASIGPVRFLLSRPSITSIINFYEE